MNDLLIDENILSDIRLAVQKLSVMCSSAEEQYDFNKCVQLKIEHEPKAIKLMCKIDGRLRNDLQQCLLKAITQAAAKHKITVSSNTD